MFRPLITFLLIFSWSILSLASNNYWGAAPRVIEGRSHETWLSGTNWTLAPKKSMQFFIRANQRVHLISYKNDSIAEISISRQNGAIKTSINEQEFQCQQEEGASHCFLYPRPMSYVLDLTAANNHTAVIELRVEKEANNGPAVYRKIDIKNAEEFKFGFKNNNNKKIYHLLQPGKIYPIDELKQAAFITAFRTVDKITEERAIIEVYDKNKLKQELFIPNSYQALKTLDFDKFISSKLFYKVLASSSIALKVNRAIYVRILQPKLDSEKQLERKQHFNPLQKKAGQSLEYSQKITNYQTSSASVTNIKLGSTVQKEVINSSWYLEDRKLLPVISEKTLKIYQLNNAQKSTLWYADNLKKLPQAFFYARATKPAKLTITDNVNRQWSVQISPDGQLQKSIFQNITFPLRLNLLEGEWPELAWEYQKRRKAPLSKLQWQSLSDYTLSSWLNENEDNLDLSWISLHRILNARTKRALQDFNPIDQNGWKKFSSGLGVSPIDAVKKMMLHESDFYVSWVLKFMLLEEKREDIKDWAASMLVNNWKLKGQTNEALDLWLLLNKRGHKNTLLNQYLMSHLNHKENVENSFSFYWLTRSDQLTNTSLEQPLNTFLGTLLQPIDNAVPIKLIDTKEILLTDLIRNQTKAYQRISKGHPLEVDLLANQLYQFQLINIQPEIRSKNKRNWLNIMIDNKDHRQLLPKKINPNHVWNNQAVSYSKTINLLFDDNQQIKISSDSEMAIRIVTGKEQPLKPSPINILNQDPLLQQVAETLYQHDNFNAKAGQWHELRTKMLPKERIRLSLWVKAIDSYYRWETMTTTANHLPSILFRKTKINTDRTENMMFSLPADDRIILSDQKTVRLNLPSVTALEDLYLRVEPYILSGINDEESVLSIKSNDTNRLLTVNKERLDVKVIRPYSSDLKLKLINPVVSRRLVVDMGYYAKDKQWNSVLPKKYVKFLKRSSGQPVSVFVTTPQRIKIESLVGDSLETEYKNLTGGWGDITPTNTESKYVRLSKTVQSPPQDIVSVTTAKRIFTYKKPDNSINASQFPIEKKYGQLSESGNSRHKIVDEYDWNTSIYAKFADPIDIQQNDEGKQESHLEIGMKVTLMKDNIETKNRAFYREFDGSLKTFGWESDIYYQVNRNWAVTANLKTYSQSSNTSHSKNQYSAAINPSIKYKYRFDENITHSDSLSWFYKKQSIDSELDVLFEPVDNDVFSQYSNDHEKGLSVTDRWTYWRNSKHLLSMKNQLKSNSNYRTLDRYHFQLGSRYAHKKLVSSILGNAYYFWHDQNRDTATWRYRLDLGLRMPWRISDSFGGWVKADIGYDPLSGHMSGQLYFSTGNDQHTLSDAWIDQDRLMPSNINYMLLDSMDGTLFNGVNLRSAR